MKSSTSSLVLPPPIPVTTNANHDTEQVIEVADPEQTQAVKTTVPDVQTGDGQ